MNIRDLITAAIRTASMALGAYIITFLLQHGWNFPDQVDVQINTALYLGVLGGWSLVVNWLTTHVSPIFGYLAIVPKAPVYGDKTALLKPEVPVEGQPPARRFYGVSDSTAPDNTGVFGENPDEGGLGGRAGHDTGGAVDVGTVILVLVVAFVVVLVFAAVFHSVH